MGRQLLIDSIGLKLHQLQESGGNGKYTFKGKFAQADTPTANKRIYPRTLWEREIKRLIGRIREGKVYGELDHPDDGKTKLQRAAVLITDLSIDKQGVVNGSMKVLNTSMGKELQAIVDDGGAVGVSSRGYGSVRMNEDGNHVVQDDFTLLTFDPVADPAEESAYPELEVIQPEAASEPQAEDEPKVDDSDSWQDEVPEEHPESIRQSESIDRNKLNKAIKQAKNVYAVAIKEASHSQALERAVEDGYQVIGSGYDRKDFAVQVAAEVMSIKKPTSEEKAGPIMDHEEILKLIKAAVQESMDNLLTDKEHALTEARGLMLAETRKLEAVQKELTEANDTVAKMSDVVKELGYSLYLQQHLGRHPKLKQIKESLGDLCRVESLEELQNKVKVHITEVARILEDEQAKHQKILDEAKAYLTEKKKLEERITALTADLEEATSIGLEQASALYLERRVHGNPYQVEIRQRFSEMKDKTKENVDRLIQEYKGRRINENGDFSKIRRSLSHRPIEVEHDRLVENHVKDTMPAIAEDRLQIQGQTFNMSEIKRLSGIGK